MFWYLIETEIVNPREKKVPAFTAGTEIKGMWLVKKVYCLE